MAGPAPNYDMQKILSRANPQRSGNDERFRISRVINPPLPDDYGICLLAIYFFKEDGGLSQMEVTRTDF